jgi:hypothetical protein
MLIDAPYILCWQLDIELNFAWAGEFHVEVIGESEIPKKVMTAGVSWRR